MVQKLLLDDSGLSYISFVMLESRCFASRLTTWWLKSNIIQSGHVRKEEEGREGEERDAIY